jgi:hypothetical protein
MLSESAFTAAQKTGEGWTFADIYTLFETVPRLNTNG